MAAGREEAGECIDVFFSTDRPVSEGAFVLDASGNERVGQLFRRLFACWASKEEGYYFSCISMLYGLFAELQKTSRAPGVHFEKIKPAMDYLHGHFPEAGITVPTLAALCGIKAAYFNRLFREQYGISPKQYVIQLRIRHAEELLRLERYTVTQVAELCGFSDLYYFSRQFKAHTGISPTQYVKKCRSSK